MPVPEASAPQAKNDFQIRIVPADGTRAAKWEKAETSGTSPFLGSSQSACKYLRIWGAGTKAQWRGGKLIRGGGGGVAVHPSRLFTIFLVIWNLTRRRSVALALGCALAHEACGYLSPGGALDRVYIAEEQGPPFRTDLFGTGSSASVAGSSGGVGFEIAADPDTIVDYMHRPWKEAALRTLRNGQAHPVLRPKMRKAKES
jgi:hypothetical protein